MKLPDTKFPNEQFLMEDWTSILILYDWVNVAEQGHEFLCFLQEWKWRSVLVAKMEIDKMSENERLEHLEW